MRALLTCLAAAALLAAPTQAHELEAGSITVEHPWARAAATANGAVYFELTNHGSAPDRLVGIISPAAEAAELHATVVDAQGVATMRPVQAVDLPAGGDAKLTPGGLHVMLVGLKGPLHEGMSFAMALMFEHAGEVGIEVEVVGEGSSAAHETGDHMPGAGMEHDSHDAGHEP